MRGRKPKPARLKLLDGNPGKRPIGREPQPPASQPSCPAHLSPTAKAEWKRLAKMLNGIGVVTQADRAVLAAYCQAYGRWVRCHPGGRSKLRRVEDGNRRPRASFNAAKLPKGYRRCSKGHPA